MTISATELDQALSEAEIKKFWLGYFQEAFREELQQMLLELYEWQRDNHGLTRADLARKIGRRPEQVTRWLSAPTNLEADTISDMALGMGMIPRIKLEPIKNLFLSGGIPNQSNSVRDFVIDHAYSNTSATKMDTTVKSNTQNAVVILNQTEPAVSP